MKCQIAVYFKIWYWMKFIFYCISKYDDKWISFSIVFQNIDWKEALNSIVFQNIVLNELLIISYGEISYKMNLGWYCIQKYDMNRCFIFHRIYRYSKKWSKCLGFFKEKSGVSGRIGPSFFEKHRRRAEIVLIEGKMCCQRVGSALLFLEKRRRRTEMALIEGKMCRQRVGRTLLFLKSVGDGRKWHS